ncbi:MAG: hypothetical protein ISN28_15680 [Ectothiorhodospiraceae bacterium AqS1]|nr:hypothetical protein [Ectothiorhodospiraceae bacterium AqS1]MBF2761673.1 hypothetical protein [Ectothiorhodospiraceae bacterium AqS1]
MIDFLKGFFTTAVIIAVVLIVVYALTPSQSSAETTLCSLLSDGNGGVYITNCNEDLKP